MASLRELRRQIKSVKSTQQITRAMKMVAAARLNRAQNRIVSARPFVDELETLLQNLAYLSRNKPAGHPLKHPLFQERESNRVDLLLVTADRGLCGAFNASLIRRTVQFLKESEGKKVHLWIVGKKGRDFFRRHNVSREKEYVGFFQRLGFHQAEIIGDDMIEHFLNSDTGEVVVIYNEFKSRIQQNLIVKRLLPVASVPEVAPKLEYIYEPDPETLVNELLPRFVKGQVYRILLESQAAELAARMTAMDNATNNAKDMIYSLTLTMNKVRQAAITTELSEIVAGAEALQN